MKKQFAAIICAILFLMVTTTAFTQDRGLLVAARAVGGADIKVGKQYAVLIAIDKYREWNPLRNPVSDAKAVKSILERRYYIDEFIELYDEDASSAGIRQLFGRLIDTVGPTDSVFLYYAGHGYTDRFNTGFWIPVDGGKNIDSQDRWIPNQQIRNFITQMKARSVALIADACFSGDLLNVQRGAAPTVDSEYFRSALRYTARQVLTSGASESVPDESEFARQLKRLLESNTEAYLDPMAMYDRIRRGVTKTLPLYGTLPGQESGGSFVLFLRDSTLPASATLVASASPAATAELIVNLADGLAAGVFVNVMLAGTDASLLQKLPAGVPLVIEARSGYDLGRLELSLKPRELREVSVKLERMKGNLFIESSEKTVEVYLDGIRAGPLGSGLFRDLAAGERMLELRGKDLYYKSSIIINGNETTKVSAAIAGVGSVQVDVPAGVITIASVGGVTRTISGSGIMTDLPAGTCTLTASGPDLTKVSGSVNIAKGTVARWKPYPTGTLQLRLQPSQASVSVDAKPSQVASSALVLEPGAHRLVFQAPGFHEKVETVSVAAGKVTALTVSLDEFARATLEIPNPPFGASVRVGGFSGIPKAGRSLVAPLVMRGIPAGLPVPFSVAVPFATLLDPAYMREEITLSEGAYETLELPVGYFSLPFLPDGARLVCNPAAIAIPLTEVDGRLLSPTLAAGTYSLALSGTYAFSTDVTIESGTTVELPGYRDAMIVAITADRDATFKKLNGKSGKTIMRWTSLGVGIASSAAATAFYFLGAQAMTMYESAVATADVQSARNQVELYGALFPATLSVGLAGLSLAPVFWLGGPDPIIRDQSLEAMENSLRKLRGE